MLSSLLSTTILTVITIMFLSFNKAFIIRQTILTKKNIFPTLIWSTVSSIDKNELLNNIINIDITQFSDVPWLLENKNDLSINELYGGNINYCFKIFQKSNPEEKALFIKKASVNSKLLRQLPMKTDRLAYEYEGVKSFAKYTPTLVPKVYYYDPINHYIVYEYLHQHKPLQELFITGKVDADIPRYAGTLMGRNHAKTFHKVVTTDQLNRYINHFSNVDMKSVWKKEFFDCSLKIIDNISTLPYSNNQQLDNTLFEGDIDSLELLKNLLTLESNVFKQSFERISDCYLNKKQTLVHSDLHCNNILYQINSDDQLDLKLVDFEKCEYGNAGIDVGFFLANYLWFFVSHSSTQIRKILLNQVIIVIDSYKSAFRIQYEGLKKSLGIINNDDNDVEKVLQDIIRDSIGFAGFYLFYLTVTNPDSKVLVMDEISGNSWGDNEGRHNSLRRRMILMSHRILELFLDDHHVLTGNSIVKVMQRDDILLQTDHYTEFWNND